MTSPISPIRNTPLPESIRLPGEAGKPGEFRQALEGVIQHVDGLRHDAKQSVEKFLSGEGEELHTIALAAQRAELAFELGLQIRNKVVQAYQEIMRMQL